MALEHAILVSLAERAGTGYDLARRFDNSIGYFWTATHQQVYKVLARMQADGWVSVTLVEQDGRPDKKVYEVTAAGRDALAGWIAEPAAPEVTRSDLAVKLRGAAHGDLDAVLAEVGRHRGLHAQRLHVYLASEKREFPDPARLQGRRLHQWLVLRGGIGLEQTAITWFDDVISALDPKSRKGTT
jgi:DNA-binding PadR family transcriptional regulator